MIRWIWDWAKYHDRHNSKSIRVTKLFFCQNDPPGPYEYIILTKEQFGRSYIFWTMPIIIFSPVSNSSNHTLSKMGQIKKKRHYITLNSPQNGIIICLIYFWFDLSHFRQFYNFDRIEVKCTVHVVLLKCKLVLTSSAKCTTVTKKFLS